MQGTRVRGRLAVGLALLLVLLLAGGQSALGALTWTEQQLTTDPNTQAIPAGWGDKVVYQDNRSGATKTDIYMADLTTGQETPIATDAAAQYAPRIYGDTIVYFDDRFGGQNEIFAYDLSSGTETRITNDPANQYAPKIHGTRIVWADERNAGDGFDVYGYDLVDGTESMITGGPNGQDLPDIFGERVVYEYRDGGDPDIHSFDMISGGITKITDNDGGDQEGPRIWGDGVVWYDNRNHNPTNEYDVYYFDLGSTGEQRITNLPVHQQNPSIFRDLIAWQDERNAGMGTDVYVHDLGDGTEYHVADEPYNQDYPDVWGDEVPYSDFRNNNDFDIWTARSSMELDRSGGATRYGTSAAISENHFASARTVVVATGADFADALSASGLAGCYGGPLILTLPDQLSPEASAEIDRLGATGATIVGGPGAVSPAVMSAIQAKGLTVDRIGGADRYETAGIVAGRIASLTGPMFEQTAFIARGDEFPDALAASPPAYYNRFPILLTRPDSLPPSTLAALSSLDIETAAVAGGTGAVSDAVKAAIDTRLVSNGGAASDRWAGPTRYETAVEVAKGATDKHWAGRGFVGLAVGDNFPDALCGGAAAGREFGLVLLVRPDSLPTVAGDFVDGSGDGIGWVEAFGGTAVVSDAVGTDVVGLAQ